MTTYRDLLEEKVKNPEFKVEWDTIHQEEIIMAALKAARLKAHLSQRELAKRSSITASKISKFENGVDSPTLYEMLRLANSLGVKLKIELVDPPCDIVALQGKN